jgi:hypothetical protein
VEPVHHAASPGSAARANARARWPAPASGRGCLRSVGTSQPYLKGHVGSAR